MALRAGLGVDLRAARTVPSEYGIGGLTAYRTLLSDYHYDWLKREGDAVEEGQTIVLIESTKASLELEAPVSGLVFRIRKLGDRVKIGDPLGIIAASKEEMEEFKEQQQL